MFSEDMASKVQFTLFLEDGTVVLSVETHRRVAIGNTRSRKAAGALAGTGPSVNGPDPGRR